MKWYLKKESIYVTAFVLPSTYNSALFSFLCREILQKSTKIVEQKLQYNSLLTFLIANNIWFLNESQLPISGWAIGWQSY